MYIILILSFILMMLMVPLIKKIAYKTNYIDVPKGRKIHKKPIPLLGGLSIFLSFNIICLLFINNINLEFYNKVTLGSFLILLLGLYDDKFDMRAILKLICQVIIAFIVAYKLGGIDSIQIHNLVIDFNFLQGVLFQAIWIVVLLNAFNLIDGLDGLATGSSIIAISSILIVSLIRNDFSNISLMLILIVILLGFLIYNFPPASIFLGDCGSMLLGYYVAMFSFFSYKSVTVTSISFLILIAFLPLIDTILAFIRRKINKVSPFKADALHMHHRLLRKGYNKKQSVLIIYGIMLFYSICSIIISFVNIFGKILILISIIIFTIFVIEKFYLLSDKYSISKYIKRRK